MRFLKKIKHIEHIALWLFIFLMIFDYHFWDGNWAEALQATAFEVFTYILVFYVNLKFIIPTFLIKKGIIQYSFSIIIWFVLYVLMIKIVGWESYFYEAGFWRNVFSMFANFGLFWLISYLFWYYKSAQEARELHLKIKAEKLATEIKFLKNQISPHFIFNTLNNIYALVLQGKSNAAPMLAKLSTILRYALYDSSQEKVFLEKEIHAIEQYIELQLLKSPISENIDFYTEGNFNNLKIVPLLFLSLVENCFKHGNLNHSEDAWIKISLIFDNDTLHFSTENSVDKFTKQPFNESSSSIGNQNIQRQLLLNYPNTHELKTTEKNNIYSTEITLFF